MPELPEIECLRREFEAVLPRKWIRNVVFRREDLRRAIDCALWKSEAVGAQVKSVRRRAKYLILDCTSGAAVLHLGMSGRLLWSDRATPDLPHTHVTFEFADKNPSKKASRAIYTLSIRDDLDLWIGRRRLLTSINISFSPSRIRAIAGVCSKAGFLFA